jgi:hypothetical protein
MICDDNETIYHDKNHASDLHYLEDGFLWIRLWFRTFMITAEAIYLKKILMFDKIN